MTRAARQDISSPLTMPARRLLRALSIDSAELFWKAIEAAHGCIEQSHRSAERSTLQVVVRGRQLDQSLEKLVHVRFGDQPERLPRFVSVPELLRIESLDAREEMERE